ncbi:MAG TPA: hypothetical protein VGA70_00505 [Longimicrobiales bacterium]|jgi:hypothetical protein
MSPGSAGARPGGGDRAGPAIFIVSFAVLLVELLLTRIYSVTMFHHLSFLAVSLAMMGLGSSGLLVSLWPRWFPREALARQVAWATVAFALGTVLVVWTAFHLPIRLEAVPGNARNAAVVFALSLVPFVSGGLVIALILTHNAPRANRLYSLDLLGAALACVAFIPMTDWLGAPTAVLFAAALGALGGAVMGAGRGPARLTTAAVAVALACAGLANGALAVDAGGGGGGGAFFDVAVAKGRNAPPTLITRWNSFSRVEVNGTPADLTTEKVPFGFGYSPRVRDFTTRELFLRYDADALTQITGFDGDLSRVAYLGYDVTAAPYAMRRPDGVLVLGAGGGRDVLTALALGSGPVTGVEVNPITIELVRGPLDDFAGGLYTGYPGVRIVRDDGRSFVRHTDERYDVIQASLVDTWAASAAGAYALAENSLYTVDAFGDYLDRLNPDGLLAFSRWYADPPVEVLRVVVLAREALERAGATDPARHVAVVRTLSASTGYPSLATILVGRSALTGDDVARLREWAGAMGFEVTYAPGGAGGAAGGGAAPGAEAFATLLGPGYAAYLASSPWDLTPVTDDRPFFFDRVPLVRWLGAGLGALVGGGGVRVPLTLGGQTLLVALLASLGFTLVLVLAPVAAGLGRDGRAGVAGAGGRGDLPWMGYFAGLGLGYIIVEIVALQLFNLYLGNPAYSLSVVLFTMLAASGLGSWSAGLWLPDVRLDRLMLGVCAAVAAYILLVPWLTDATLGLGTAGRVLVVVAATAPVAFLMGMPFPTGLRRADRISNRLVPWGWAVNGGASVLGSVLAVVASMTWGFTAAFGVGLAAYAGAAAMARVLERAPKRA